MSRALCVTTDSTVDWSRYGCPSGYMPMYTPRSTDEYIVGEQVKITFYGFIDVEKLITGAGEPMGVFHSIPVQDVLVAVFLFVMFGIGFVGGVMRK